MDETPVDSIAERNADEETRQEDAASTRAAECYRDVSQMRLFLLGSLTRLRNREAAIKRFDSSLPGVGEIHADCLQLVSEEIECESLRAAYATISIQAEAAKDDEKNRQWRRMLADTGRMWLERSRTVERLVCRLEAAFLRHVIKFADGVACGNPDIDALARKLNLLAEAFVALEARLDFSLSCEFELCRNRLQEFLNSGGQRESPPINATSQLQQTAFAEQAKTAPMHCWPAVVSQLASIQQQQQHLQQHPDHWQTFRWFLWLVVILFLAALATYFWRVVGSDSCWWDLDLLAATGDRARPY